MVALALGMGAFAQETSTSEGKGFSKGDFVLTGSVGFASEKIGDIKTNGFVFSPSAAYFLTDNISLGLFVGVAGLKEEEPTGPEAKTTDFMVGPQARYYFTPKNDFSLFLQLTAQFQTSKFEQGPIESKQNGFGASFSPGVSYFVSPHFALQATVGAIGFETMKDKDTDVKRDNFAAAVDLTNINFGLVYKF